MNARKWNAARFVLVLSLAAGGLGHSQSSKDFGQEMDLQILDDYYTIQKKEALKPLDELNGKYIAALEKCAADQQAAGNLDGILEAKKAIDASRAGQLPDEKSPVPAVEKLEQVFLKQRAETEKSLEVSLRKADKDFITVLEDLAIRLTKAGKIDDALKVRARLEDVKAKLAAATPAIVTSGPGAASMKIISASYGSGGKYADVTERIRDLLEVRKKAFSVVPGHIGVDPTPGWNKNLVIKYRKDGVDREQNRTETETVLPESFWGPQDKAELQKWLAGSRWKAGNDEIVFDANETFAVAGHLGNYRWQMPEFRKLILKWSDSESVECSFDWAWSSIQEKSGGKRLFKKVK